MSFRHLTLGSRSLVKQVTGHDDLLSHNSPPVPDSTSFRWNDRCSQHTARFAPRPQSRHENLHNLQKWSVEWETLHVIQKFIKLYSNGGSQSYLSDKDFQDAAPQNTVLTEPCLKPAQPSSHFTTHLPNIISIVSLIYAYVFEYIPSFYRDCTMSCTHY